MTEEYTKIYCESMAKSLDDKLFFLDIETKFGYELKYPTHKQIIFVKD